MLQFSRRPDGHVGFGEQRLQLCGVLPHVDQVQEDATEGWSSWQSPTSDTLVTRFAGVNKRERKQESEHAKADSSVQKFNGIK